MIIKIESKDNLKNVNIISSIFHFSISRKFDSNSRQFASYFEVNLMQI